MKAMTLPTVPAPLPPSVLDQLRQWRLQASLRFVAKSLPATSTGKVRK